MDASRIRNLGIAAHIDAGKTTVSERMLFDAGVEHRLGHVDEGTTVLDWMPEERERGITISAAATTIPWRDHAINLIDTPGHVDFTAEVERSMRVLDGAILVLDAVMGVQAQSEAVHRQMRRHEVPHLIFVNKLDRQGADYLRVASEVHKRLGIPAIPVQYPLFEITSGSNTRALRGIVDLLDGRTWLFDGSGRTVRAVEDFLAAQRDAGLRDEVLVLRAELFDALAAEDEALLECLTSGRVPERAELVRVLRRCTISGTLVPVLCGMALRNLGIQPLLDAVVDYLPSPLDLPPVRGIEPDSGRAIDRKPSAEEPFSALAFKLQAQGGTDLTFVRVYSGTVRAGDSLWNPRMRHLERSGRILRMHADSGVAVESAGPGDIVALMGLKHTGTGDTLCTPAAPIALESLTFPEPVLSLVLEPVSSNDRDKLRSSLARLAHEDPSLWIREDAETGQWIVAGMGELHLEVLTHRLEREFRLPTRVGAPRVAYREALVEGSRASARIERTQAGKEIFGAVEIEVVPDREVGSTKVELLPGGAIPAAYHKSILETLVLDAHSGPRFGFPLVNVRIRVLGGESDPRRNAESAFVQAASSALGQAFEKGKVAILEPWMAFEIQVPHEFAPGLMADLNTRLADIAEVNSEGARRSIRGHVALSRMVGYSTAMRSLSQGRADFSMVPAGYRRVPESELAARGFAWG